MGKVLPIVLAIAFAAGSGCGSSDPSGATSCYEYYATNEPNITPARQDFCLNQGSKTSGNCCTANRQCISNNCCGWGQPCGTSASCECVGP